MGEYWRLRPTPEQLGRLQKAIKEYGRQGEIVLPKEDKYEKFKEYIDGIAPHNCIRQIKILFNDFEEELKEKEQKNKIIHKIGEIVWRNTKPDTPIIVNAERIYKELKEEGLLK